MDGLGCFLWVLVIVWGSVFSTPIANGTLCRVDDIPVSPEFAFSQLSGVWYGVGRTTTMEREDPWTSYVWNFVQGPDGTIGSFLSGYSPLSARCKEPEAMLLEPLEPPGSFSFHTFHEGVLRVVYVSDTAGLLYICFKPAEDNTCPDNMRAIVYLSRDQSLSRLDYNQLEVEMEDLCLKDEDVHETEQGQCGIPFTSASLVNSDTFQKGVPHRSVHVASLTTLILSCESGEVMNPKVVWTRATSHGPIVLSFNTNLIYSDVRISVDRPAPSNWNLIIHNIKLEDEGIYFCSSSSSTTHRSLIRYIVTVLEPPHIVNGSDDNTLSINAGEKAQFTCGVDGNPKPSIHWFLQDELTNERKGCGELTLDMVFVVETSTTFGKTNIDLTVDFIRYFLVPSNVDDRNMRIGLLTFSDTAIVQFHLSDYPDKRKVYKSFDSVLLSESSEVKTGEAIHLARTSMFTALHGDRQDVKNVIVLVYQGLVDADAAKTVEEANAAKGQGIHMYVVHSNAKDDDLESLATEPEEDNQFTLLKFEAIKDWRNELFTTHCPEPDAGGQTLTFNAARKEDLGHYMCVASNGVGPPVSRTFELKIYFKPLITAEQTVVKMRLGQSATLTCTVEANPMDENLNWRFNWDIITTDLRRSVTKNEERPTKLDFSLTIGSLVAEDFGVYTCLANTSMGAARLDIRLEEIVINDDCDLNRTQIQEDFDPWKFLGEWHRVKALTYYYGSNTYTSERIVYYINSGGYLASAYRGKVPEAAECQDPGVIVYEQQSPGKYRFREVESPDTYQIVYTDYTNAIIYVCSKFDENGHCPHQNNHVEIITKKYPIPEAKMAELEQMVSHLCVDLDDMVDATYGGCEFPSGYLESVGYGAGGVNQDYLCDVERTRIQAGFDIHQFVGEWQTVKTTTFRYRENTPTSETLHYFLREDGQLILAHTSLAAGSCSNPGHMELQEVQPGKYTLEYGGNTGSIQVVYTDYDTAITISCSNMADNGLCPADEVNVQIIAKHHPVTESKMAELDGYVKGLCIKQSDMVENTPDKCSLSIAYLESVGLPVTRSCIVTDLPVQENFDKNRFLGKWNIIKTISSQYGSKVYLTAVQDYFLKEDGALSTAYRGYLQGSDFCLNSGVIVFEKYTSGDFVFNTLIGQGKFKIIYTDYNYAVTYSCRGMDENGECIEGAKHASILAREDNVNTTMMVKLENYVKWACVDPAGLLEIVQGQCSIPEEFLESVGYSGPDKCRVANIPSQADFDVNQFLGKWKIVKTLTYLAGSDVYRSMSHKYFLDENNHLTLVFRGYNATSKKCLSSRSMKFQNRSAGYFYSDRIDSFKIVYTDYKYAVGYVCFSLLTDGHCLKETTQVSIMSRDDFIPDDKLEELMQKVSDLCVDTNDLVDLYPDACLITGEDLVKYGYIGPPEDECLVESINYQKDLNVTELEGDWYTLISTGNSEHFHNESLGPDFYHFAGWNLLRLSRAIDSQVMVCEPTVATTYREVSGPGDYTYYLGANLAVFRILHACPRFMVTYTCLEENLEGFCATNKSRVTILSRSKVIEAEYLDQLKKFVTTACLETNSLRNNIFIDCLIPSEIKEVAASDLVNKVREDYSIIGCRREFIPIQENLDIYKFADTAWKVLWRSSSIWDHNPSSVPGIDKRVEVTPPGDDGDDDRHFFLVSRSYKKSWEGCEPTEVLKLTQREQTGDYSLKLGDSINHQGLYRIMYADNEYAVTYTCFDTSTEECPEDMRLVEILSTHDTIPFSHLLRLRAIANSACGEVRTMANSNPDACHIPDNIVNAVHQGQITTDYAMPVLGCDGNLIQVDPDFDLSLFTESWNVVYSSVAPESAGASLTLFYEETDHGLFYARKAYNVSEQQCSPAEAGILLERSRPGDYASILDDFPVIFKVLDVEDRAAVVFVCFGMADDGSCARDSLVINILAHGTNLSQEDVTRLTKYAEGTCAEVEDIERQTPGLCTIPDKVISAVEYGEVDSDYFPIECSMFYIHTAEVSTDQITGSWVKSVDMGSHHGRRYSGHSSYIAQIEEGTDGVYIRSYYNNSRCEKTEALRLTYEKPGSFSIVKDDHLGMLKVLYLDETEMILYTCIDQNEDGTCKEGHADLSINSRNSEISEEKLRQLEKYASQVCLDKHSLFELQSSCPISEEIQELATSGEITEDHAVISCMTRFVPVQPDFNMNRFVGLWYSIAFTAYYEGFETWSSYIADFRITENGRLTYMYTGYDRAVPGCEPVDLYYITEVSPGHYSYSHSDYTTAFKVIYTDYVNAVLYWCTLIKEDGTCDKGFQHIEILSKDIHMENDTRQKLMTYVHQGCLHQDSDFHISEPVRCLVPAPIQTAVEYDEVTLDPGNYQVSCLNQFIEAQRHFDMQQFTGDWYTVAITHAVWGDNTWENNLKKFSLLEDGSFIFSYTGYAESSSSCFGPVSGELYHMDKGGHFLYQSLDKDVTLKVIYTDYEVAVVYHCLQHREDGSCYKNKTVVELMSRTPNISEAVHKSLYQHVRKLCFHKYEVYPSRFGLCEFPQLNEGSIERKICSYNDVVPTPDFSFLQISGLWYEVARTRFTYNQVESSVVFYSYLADTNMFEGKYIGNQKGTCQPPLSSLTKAHDDGEELDSHLLAKLGDINSPYPWVGFKIIYFDGQYLMFYACYHDHNGGTCPRDKTEVTLFGRVHGLDRNIRAKIPTLMRNVCLTTEDLIESIDTVDCTSNLFTSRAEESEPLVEPPCSPLSAIHVEENVTSIELVGKWKAAFSSGFQSHFTDVTINRYSDRTFQLLLEDSENGEWNQTVYMKPKCRDIHHGEYMASETQVDKGQWGSMKIVYSSEEITMFYWCKHEKADGSCDRSSIRVLLLSRSQPMFPEVKSSMLGKIKDTCFNPEPHDEPTLRASIPGAVLGYSVSDGVLDDRSQYNSVTLYTTYCAVDNIPAVNFDQGRQSGVWFEIARTPSSKFSMESTVGYFLPVGTEGHMNMIYSGISSHGECISPMIGEIKPRCPAEIDGHYMGRMGPSSNLWITWKILYTDYDQAMVAYSCMDEEENGQCAPESTRVHIMSRTHTIEPNILANLHILIESACFDPNTLVQTTYEETSCLNMVEETADKIRTEQAPEESPPPIKPLGPENSHDP